MSAEFALISTGTDGGSFLTSSDFVSLADSSAFVSSFFSPFFSFAGFFIGTSDMVVDL